MTVKHKHIVIFNYHDNYINKIFGYFKVNPFQHKKANQLFSWLANFL